MGVWIEIVKELNKEVIPAPSLPSWECGLKFFSSLVENYLEDVTPLVGVWIEIYGLWTMILCHTVTPLVGVGIEIGRYRNFYSVHDSHSPRGSVD